MNSTPDMKTEADWHTLLAIDSDKWACATYAANLSPGDAVEMTQAGLERNCRYVSCPPTGVFLGYCVNGRFLRVRRIGENEVGSYLPDSWKKIGGGE